MPKKRSKSKKNEQQEIKQVVDKAQRVIQGLAIVALVVIIAVDFYTPDTTVEVWIKGGLLAVGIGLSPKQILEFVRGKDHEK